MCFVRYLKKIDQNSEMNNISLKVFFTFSNSLFNFNLSIHLWNASLRYRLMAVPSACRDS